MGTLLRTLRYGSHKLKAYLSAVILLLVGGIGVLAAGLLTGMFPMMIVGFVLTAGGGLMCLPLSKVEQEEEQRLKDKSDAAPQVLVGEEVGEVKVIDDPERVDVLTSEQAAGSLENIRKSLLIETVDGEGSVSADELVSGLKEKADKVKASDVRRITGLNADGSVKKDVSGKTAAKSDIQSENKPGEGRKEATVAEPESKPDDATEGSPAEGRITTSGKANEKAKDSKRPYFYVGENQRVGIQRSEKQKRLVKKAQDIRSGKVKKPINGKLPPQLDENGDPIAEEPLRGELLNADHYGTYTKDRIKKLLKQYKVSKDYVPVVIDRSRRFDVVKTPALCWKKGSTVHFLLFEQAAREIEMSFFDFRRVTYKKSVTENDLAAYDNIRKSLDTYSMFESAMPTFNVSGDGRGRSIYSKNLYVFGDILEMTPGSMRALNAKFSLDTDIFGSFDLRGSYSDYFIDAYEAKTLWADNVISQNEFRDRIRNILQDLTDDRDISVRAFNDDLDRMIRYKLVTEEYADFYRAKRQQ